MARSTSARRLGRILALLKDEMTWAWSALEVARALEQRHDPAQASGLSAFIHRAARQEAILSASRLISSDQESVTLHYLMDHVRHHPQIFRGASPGELDRLLARWDQDWLEWREFATRLRAYRDRRLAHLDRKALNEPEAFSSIEISLEDLSGLLEFVQDQVGAIYGLYHNKQLDLQPLREEIGRAAGCLAVHLHARDL